MRRPLRRAAALVALLLVGISCGRDATGPVRGAMSAPITFRPQFMGDAAQSAMASGIDFASVRVLLTRTDTSRAVVLDRVVPFAATDTLVTLPLSVPFSSAATADGELFLISLAYVTASGDTVFRGGPAQVLAQPAGSTGADTPTEVSTRYTGPGSQAVRVVLTPDSVEVQDLASFSFTVQALDAQGATVANAPIRLSTPDTALITLSSGGAGIARSTRGVARVVATILTGAPDTSRVSVRLRASAITALSGSGQSGTAGSALANPIVVKVTASDGVPVAGVPVSFTASSGGSTAVPSAVTDANGLASTGWTLGTSTGTQSVVASATGLTGQAIFSATATAGPVTALVITSGPTSGTAVSPLAPIVVQARDQYGNVNPSFTRTVNLVLSTNPGDATLGGGTSVPAVSGIATFSTVTVNRPATGYQLTATVADSSNTLVSSPSAAFTVTTGPATQLGFVVPPTGATVGQPITPAVVVAAQDAAGNTVTSYTGQIGIFLVSSPSGATLGGTTPKAAVAGLATFSDLTLSVDGTGYTLAAGATGLTSVISAPFTTSPAAIRWTNASGGSWWTAANWDAGRVPTSSDSVFITLDGTYTVTADSLPFPRALVIGGTSGTQTLSLVQNGSGSNMLGAGTITIGSNAEVRMANVNLAGATSVQLDGTLVLAGVAQLNAPITSGSTSRIRVLTGAFGVGNTTATILRPFVNNGTLELVANDTQVAEVLLGTGGMENGVTGSIVASGGSGFRSIYGSLLNAGTISVGASLGLTAAGTAIVNQGSIAVTGGDLGISVADGTFTNTGSIIVDSTRTLTLGGGAVQLAAAGTVSGAGTVQFNSTAATVAQFGSALLTASSSALTLDVALAPRSIALYSTTVTGSGSITIIPSTFLTLQNSSVGTAVAVEGGYVSVLGTSSITGAFSVAANSVVSIDGSPGGANATLTVANGFTNRGVLNLTGFGGFNSSLTIGSGTLVIESGAALFANGSEGLRQVNAPIDNRGNLFANTVDLVLAATGSGNANSGVMRATGGSITVALAGGSPSFTNTGTIVADSTRWFRVEGGSFTHGSAGVLTGLGALSLVDATATLDGALGTNLIASGSVVTSTPTIDLPLVNLTATVLDGSGVRVAPGHQLILTAATLNAPLQNEGQVLLSGTVSLTGALTNVAGAQFEVIGGFVAQAATAVTVANGFTNLGTLLFENSGTYDATLTVANGVLVNEVGGNIVSVGTAGARKLAATLDNRGQLTTYTDLLVESLSGTPSSSGGLFVYKGTLTFHQTGTTPGLELSGTVFADTAATLAVLAGTVNVANGTTITGGGTLSLRSANANIAASIGTRFDTDYGSITFTAPLASPSVTFVGSTVNGDGSIAVGPGDSLTAINATVELPMTVSGAVTLIGTAALNGAVLMGEAATMRISAALDGRNGTANTNAVIAQPFTNYGLLELFASDSLQTLLEVPGGLINASGATIRALGTAGTRTILGTVDNGGTLTALAPITIAASDATHVNSGLIDATAADVTYSQNGTSGSLTSTGTIATASGHYLNVFGGALLLSSGAVTGDGSLSLTNTATTMAIAPASDLGMNGGSLVLQAAFAPANASFNNTAVSGAPITVAAGKALAFLGTSSANNQISVDGTLILAGDPTLSGSITTSATSHLRVASGDFGAGNTVATIVGPLTNNGLLELEGTGGSNAQLALTGGNSFQNANGATVRTLGLGGARTITASTLENQGSMVLGPGIASTLTLEGFFVGGNTSSLTMDVGTGGADQLKITGQASLAGALSLTALSGYTPPPATTLTLVTSTGPLGGTFIPVTLPAGFNANPSYSANAVSVSTP